MEDPKRDSEDSETSSEGSWILLSKQEVTVDSVSVEDTSTVNSLGEVVDKLKDTDIKNIQSDTESDGISIIGESDCSQNSESDDDYNNIAMESPSENHEVSEDKSIKAQKVFTEIDTKEQYENLIEVETKDLKDECSVKTEKFSFYVKENVVKNEQMVENSSSQIISNLKEKTSFYICLNHLKRLVSWPYFLSTSIVIFAFIIFPYFLKINNANTLERFIEIVTKHKHSRVSDSLDLLNCLKVIKQENDTPYLKHCIKKLTNHRRKLINDNGIAAELISSSKEENEKDHWIEYTHTFLVKKKYKCKEEYRSRDESHKDKKLYENFQVNSNIVPKRFCFDSEDEDNFSYDSLINYFLTDRNIEDSSYLSLLLCMTVIEEENDTTYFKLCKNMILKHMRSLTNKYIVLELMPSRFFGIKENNKEDNLNEYTDTFLVKKKYKVKEENFLSPSEISMNVYNVDVNSEEYYDLIKSKEKHVRDLHNSQYSQKDINDSKGKNFKTHFEKKKKCDKLKEELIEIRKSMFEKEKFLKKCREQLTEEELRLQKKTKEKHNQKNEEKKMCKKPRKQKGDFVERRLRKMD